MAASSFFRRFVLLAIYFVAIVDATQVMHRPARYKDAPNKFSLETDPKTQVIHKRASGKASIAYFTNWGIYGANFREQYASELTGQVIESSHPQNQLTSYPAPLPVNTLLQLVVCYPDAFLDILYAFADTDASSGAISLTDSYADEQVMPFNMVPGLVF